MLAASTQSLDNVLGPFIYVFYAAWIVAFLFTPVMQKVASFYGIIDQPDRVRKMHSIPVAYLGGIAVFLGWLAGMALSQYVRVPQAGSGPFVRMKLAVIIGACVIVVLGLWDDLWKIKPRIKILGQVSAAVILLACGVGTHCMAPILNPVTDRLAIGGLATGNERFPEWFVLLSSCAVMIVLMVACCNAANLMDGLDGLCGGVTAIMTAGLLFLAVNLATGNVTLDKNWDYLRIAMGLALLGAVLGFVPYNFNPASIFMGDAGSMFLGYASAVMIVTLAQEQSKWFLAGMVIFALPFLDTALALARRWVNGRPFFSADRQHFHHQLVGRGLTVKQTVLVSYGLTIGFTLLGASLVYMRTRYAVASYLVIFGWLIVASYKMGMVHERPRVVGLTRMGPVAFSETTVAAPGPGEVVEIRALPPAGAANGPVEPMRPSRLSPDVIEIAPAAGRNGE
jgi:UDP-GlcNAc:undecaprenyl-phosphate GlcNAc-1-phosphate transferase